MVARDHTILRGSPNYFLGGQYGTEPTIFGNGRALRFFRQW
jgi:hypothetical protein